jgi:N-acetylmuramic acid 6-phosphate etherase
VKEPTSSRAHLSTEQRGRESAGFDRLSVADAVALMQSEDRKLSQALAAARDSIAAAVELVVAHLERGGRLIYVGAGTSGRLGVLDAVECPPTFLSDPRQVVGVIAGGAEALTRAVEGAEDDAGAARRDLEALELRSDDVVFGITAGGTTAYVHAAIELARERGAASVFLACVPREQAADRAEVSIRVVTGPEVLTGSTRLKAGTATKLVLNTVTTVAMAQLGKVYDNLMVDVDTRTNAKLVDRGARVVAAATGVERERALELLRAAGGRAKVAIVMQRLGCDAADAQSQLDAVAGNLRRALGE